MSFAEICLASNDSLGYIIFSDHFVNPRILDPEFLPNLSMGVKVGKGLSFFLSGSLWLIFFRREKIKHRLNIGFTDEGLSLESDDFDFSIPDIAID